MLKKILNPFKWTSKQVTKYKDCVNHDFKKLPNVFANEYCNQCDIQMCYMCGNQHSEAGHVVYVAEECNINNEDHIKQSYLADQFSTQSYDKILKNFNYGYLMQMDLGVAECPCGTKIDKTNQSGICVACGNATCSNECHHHYLEQKELCQFHHNFSMQNKDRSMRSITLKNIHFLQKQGYGRGTVVNRTSQNFIMGYLTSSPFEIYLQRGFRQYGNPMESTLKSLKEVQGAQLDFEMNLFKPCDCPCNDCAHRGYHSILNCQHVCKTDYLMRLREIISDQGIQDQCDCTCDFCQSGITVFKHKKIDCMRLCYRSSLRK